MDETQLKDSIHSHRRHQAADGNSKQDATSHEPPVGTYLLSTEREATEKHAIIHTSARSGWGMWPDGSNEIFFSITLFTLFIVFGVKVRLVVVPPSLNPPLYSPRTLTNDDL